MAEKFRINKPITITRKAGTGSGKRQNRSRKKTGTIQSRKEEQYLARRKKASGLVNFYDLGQIFQSGSWTDADFSILPEDLPDFDGDTDPLELSDYAQRDAFFLSAGVENLENRFRKVEKAHGEVFKIAVTGLINDEIFAEITAEANQNWTDQGLKLTPAQLSAPNFTVRTDADWSKTGNVQIFTNAPAVLTGEEKNHITDEFDPEADPVFYQPKNGDIFFLIPELMYSRIGAQVQAAQNWRYFLNLFWCFHKRSQFLNDPFHSITYQNRNWSNSSTNEDYYAAFSTVPIEKQRAAARRFAVQNPGTGSFGAASDFPPAEFPPPPAVPIESGDTLFFFTNYGTQLVPDGVLILIIKQGSRFLYVWK